MDRGGAPRSDIAAELAAVRAQNDELIQTLKNLNAGKPAAGAAASLIGAGGVGGFSSPPNAGGGFGSASFVGGGGGAPPGLPELPGAPKRSIGDMKLWVGSWNMGTHDPFQNMDFKGADRDVAVKTLAPFIPLGYDVYVLGVQEGVCEAIFEAIEMYTETYRLPLNCRIYPARDTGKVRSRRMGRAIKVQSFLDDKSAGFAPEPVVTTNDMLDRVWGRGDGALLTPKYTGIAVFVAPIVAPYVRLLGMYKHSFGASEGSKGGVGVTLGLYDVTVAFINTHMASKRPEMRRQQYQEIVDRLGSKLGGRGFGLNESFHHIIWMGDLNVHCVGVSASDAVSLIRSGRHMQLLLQHDELLLEKDNETSFFEYEEPLMAPRFFPTYKKLPGRGKVETSSVNDADWVSKVYVTAYKEPFYKGGRVMERVPGWPDRIQYHSLPDRWGELLPEPLDPSRPDASIHNYHAVNDVLDTSDHSPVFATFSLQICAEEVDENVEAFVEAQQAELGYRQAEDGTGGDEEKGGAGGGTTTTTRQLPPVGPITDIMDLSMLHPALRPLQVDITLYGIVVNHKGGMVVPRAVSTCFPLPYEDSNEIPDRRKVSRESGFPFFSRGQDSLAMSMRTLVSRANRLETLHLLLKVSLDDNTKAQCVICLKDGGFVGAGTHVNTFLQPLTMNGLPLRNGHGHSHSESDVSTVSFTMEMTAYERGGTQAVAPQAPVTARAHPSTGMKRNGSSNGSSTSPIASAASSSSSSSAVAPTMSVASTTTVSSSSLNQQQPQQQQQQPSTGAPKTPAPPPSSSSIAPRPPVAIPASSSSQATMATPANNNNSVNARITTTASNSSLMTPAPPSLSSTGGGGGGGGNALQQKIIVASRAQVNVQRPAGAKSGTATTPGSRFASGPSSVVGDDYAE